MKIRKAKMLFVVLAVAGLNLTVVAEGEERDVPEVLTGISQDSPLYARMCYLYGKRLFYGKGVAIRTQSIGIHGVSPTDGACREMMPQH